MKDRIIAEVVLILFGFVLFIDGLFIHAIQFDYTRFNLQALDPIINHWMIGLAMIGISAYDLHRNDYF